MCRADVPQTAENPGAPKACSLSCFTTLEKMLGASLGQSALYYNAGHRDSCPQEMYNADA